VAVAPDLDPWQPGDDRKPNLSSSATPTQTWPAPNASYLGMNPVSIRATISFVLGSILTTVPRQ
jgi:hypothetical protein